MARRVIGWTLDREDRARLLERIPPAYPDAVADHVTLRSGVGQEEPLPTPQSCELVGVVDDGEGVQALVARLGGTTARPDGGTFHVTWSLDRKSGRTARESNDAIARLGWTPFAEPIPVRVEPAEWSS